MADDDYLSDSELVDVRILESKAHSELCAVQTYCLHGGTCYRLPSLGMHYCQCTQNYEGKRCHMKKVSPDLDARKINDVAFNWELVKPLILVGAGVIVSAVALICIYFLISYCCRKCSDRKGKYMLTQKSVSQDALVIEVEENFADGDVTRQTRKASTRSRTRLAACSSTPEQAKPFHVQTTPSATATGALEKVLALANAAELGNGDFVDPNGGNEEEEKKRVPTAEALSSPIDRPVSFHGAASADGAAVASLTHASEEALARRRPNCQSPSDSNNNDDMATCNASLSAHPLHEQRLGGQNKRPTDFGRQKIPPFDDHLHRYNGVSVHNNTEEVLYDSDPDATAL